VGGVASNIIVVIYSIGLAISTISIIVHIFFTKSVGIGVGLYTKDGSKKIDMKKYDDYITLYEKRNSTWIFWLSLIPALVWPVIFILMGLNILFYINIAVLLGGEIGRYRIYKHIKKNRAMWGAAAYINEVQDFFSKK
jgi:hypothetical protein